MPEKNKNAMSHVFTVAILVCLVCSIFVSTAAVYLKPLQEYNKELERKRNILVAAGLLETGGDGDIDQLFEQIEVRIVDLATGEYTNDVDPATFDAKRAAKDPAQNQIIASGDDLAGIKRRAKYARVYLSREGETLKRLILPIHGKGLWSTMYGFLAFETDLNTIRYLAFYEHGETPGLGGEVDNPRWKALWDGKLAFDAGGAVAIEVIKGAVVQGNARAIHQVDGLSGATLTARGASNLVRYWLGEDGFGPFLRKMRKEGV